MSTTPTTNAHDEPVTDMPHQPKHRAWTSWFSRRTFARSQALEELRRSTTELAEAEGNLLRVRQDAARFDDARQARFGKSAEPAASTPAEQGKQSEADERVPWTWYRVLFVGLSTVTALPFSVAMALVAIGLQTGFWAATLPASLRVITIGVSSLHHTFSLPQAIPIVMEGGSWTFFVLAIVAIVFRRSPHWYTLFMWILAGGAGVINAVHNSTIGVPDGQHNWFNGIALGLLSIVGPFIAHSYVLSIENIIKGKPIAHAIGNAIAGTTSPLGGVARLVLAVGKVVWAVVLVGVIGAVLHPVITGRTISIWSGCPDLSFRQARAIANARYRHNIRRELAAIGLPNAQAVGIRARLAVRLAAWIAGTGKDEPITGMGVHIPTVVVPPAQPPVPPRPDTGLSSAGDGRPPGGVLTADPEPFDRSTSDPNGGVRAFGDSVRGVHPGRSYPAWIDDPTAVKAQLDELAKLLDGASDTEANGDPNGERSAFGQTSSGGVRDAQDSVRGVPATPNADRSPERSPDRSTPTSRANAGERSNGGQANAPKANGEPPANGEPNAQANDAGANGERSNGGANATGPNAQANGAEANGAGANGERHLGEANGPEDTGTITNAAMITMHYWTSFDLGLDVQNMVRADIARELNIPEPTVRKIWNECLKGKRPRIAGAGSGGHSRSEGDAA